MIFALFPTKNPRMTPEQLTTIVDTINHAAWAIVGSLWAVIFATSWKG